MGLCATAKGLTGETEYNCGYISYVNFLRNLASCYDEAIGEMYEKLLDGKELTEAEEAEWDKRCDPYLDLLLFHSSCDGKFTWQECRGIYNTIKDLRMDLLGHNYSIMEPYNMLEHWKNIFRHCAKRRVTLWYY